MAYRLVKEEPLTLAAIKAAPLIAAPLRRICNLGRS